MLTYETGLKIANTLRTFEFLAGFHERGFYAASFLTGDFFKIGNIGFNKRLHILVFCTLPKHAVELFFFLFGELGVNAINNTLKNHLGRALKKRALYVFRRIGKTHKINNVCFKKFFKFHDCSAPAKKEKIKK